MKDPLVTIRNTKNGPMMLLTTDTVISRQLLDTGDHASAEKVLLGKLLKAGDIVIDVGANIGNFTLFLARKVGEKGAVYSFEAQRFLYYILCGNVALNGLTQARCFQMAVGASNGDVAVPAPDYAKPGDFGGLALKARTKKEYGTMMSLDGMKFQKCSLIRIGVAGMERDVLIGAAATIRKFKPLLYIENHRPEQSDELLGYITGELKYFVYKHGQNVLCTPTRQGYGAKLGTLKPLVG